MLTCDADGVFSASSLHNYLLDIEYNGEIIPFFHVDKKHGLTDSEVFNRIKNSDIKLLICPDSSSSDYEQHKELHDMGIDVIVLDHHSANKYSEHAIVINNQLSPNVTNKHGSGTLVTHKFLQYIDMMTGFDYAEQYYDRVAISLVTDVCDVRSYENRFYLAYGLENIKDRTILGLVNAKNGDKEINAYNLSWNVNPCLNSYIRNGKSELLYESLVFPDNTCIWKRVRMEKEKEWNICDRVVVESQATQTKQSNDVRKYMKQLSEQVNEDDKVIIVEVDDKFNLAYTGLVAGKLSSNFGKPAVVVHDNNGKMIGSVRGDNASRIQFDASNLFVYNAGHDFSAFGTCFYKSKLDDIKSYFNSLDMASELTCEVVKCFTTSTIPMDLFELIEANMGLFGKGLEVPQFCIKDIKVNANEVNWYSQCMRLLHKGISYTKFFPNQLMKDEWLKDTEDKLNVTLVGKIGINEYQGYRNQQMVIDRYEVEEDKRIWSIEDIF